ncbi:glycosyltransferase family 69 protein [Sporormia fimetaria CBS 119925]|uniref:Glycosyltransferase family 69 protein n=1 Tax=Sporormia fimetaria CBS 119925 TaxID=1340428 RepID=A0A6A6VAT5_9PLEO|nr:glycosyltransferase family 69 protein [Sporormia fimetaria CBS 119925]
MSLAAKLRPFTPRIRNRRSILRHPVVRVLFILLLVFDTIHVLDIHSHQAIAHRRSSEIPSPLPPNTRIFIASQHWNSARLLRSGWTSALLSLVQHLGPRQVFVSIYESGSYDDTKGALWELLADLQRIGVGNKVVLDDKTHQDEIKTPPTGEAEGWVQVPRGSRGAGEMAMRRIPFLAGLRNKVLEPLQELDSQGNHFDYILFLNDVVFSPADVLHLLATRNYDYAAACALDFNKPPAYYDTFALRDSQGDETVSLYWPYFRSSSSRRAAEHFEPVPVTSCWNGMVVMPTAPFLLSSINKDPIRFRAIPDSLAKSHLEGSECCLIHADNPLSATHGVWLNPNIRVGYNSSAYNAVQSESFQMSPLMIWVNLWWNRVLRWTSTPLFKKNIVSSRVAAWKKGAQGSANEVREEAGEFCMIDEMQVLHAKGWRHV